MNEKAPALTKKIPWKHGKSGPWNEPLMMVLLDLVLVYFDHQEKFNDFSNELNSYLIGVEPAVHPLSIRQLFNFLSTSLIALKRSSDDSSNFVTPSQQMLKLPRSTSSSSTGPSASSSSSSSNDAIRNASWPAPAIYNPSEW